MSNRGRLGGRMDAIAFLSDYLFSTLRLSVPLAYAALGGLWSERSGVLNIGLEGMMLTGAFTSAAVTFSTGGNLWLGVLATVLVGAMVGLLHAFLCITLRIDQLVSGLAINLSAAGLTAFLSRLVFTQKTVQELPEMGAIALPLFHQLPILGSLLFHQDPLVYLLFLLVPLSSYILFHTSLGLGLRAVGEHPRAAATSGISVYRVRYFSVILSGILAALGGAYLVLVHVRFFTEGITAGRGFIALAALIFGRWHPLATVLACVLFGATDALQFRIQALNLHIPYQFLMMLPYAIALLAMVGLAGKSTPPAALGSPYHKESAE